MYAVMFYVILNKRKLHFPLAKNVMHSPSNNWRAGASLPSRPTGAIFLSISSGVDVCRNVLRNSK